MPAQDDSSQRTDDERQSTLIRAVPIDAVIALSRHWSTLDQSYTQNRRTLEAGIKKLRETLQAAQLAAAEQPGEPASDAKAAIGALDRSRDALTRAVQSRATAQKTLENAQEMAERALVQIADVVVARRAITAIAIILLLVLIPFLFS